MKIPACIKHLVAFTDTESSRYALAGIKCTSQDGVAAMTATDGCILASVHWKDEQGPDMDVIVDAKQLASPPAAAFKVSPSGKGGVSFDGKTVFHGNASITPAAIEGRFPRIEDVFAPVGDGSGYVSVTLNPAYLRALCDLAGSASVGYAAPHITLWVKDATSCVMASTRSPGGEHIVRMAIMPIEKDEVDSKFPDRPGAVALAEETAAESGEHEPQPAPPPEVLDDDAIAEAVTREPEPIGEYGTLAPV